MPDSSEQMQPCCARGRERSLPGVVVAAPSPPGFGLPLDVAAGFALEYPMARSVHLRRQMHLQGDAAVAPLAPVLSAGFFIHAASPSLGFFL